MYKNMLWLKRNDEDELYRIFLAKTYPNMFKEGKMLAWDITRATTVIRYSYTAGYIDEDEAWRILEGIELPAKLKQTYQSWENYADHYLIGRNFWSKTRSDDRDRIMRLAILRLSEMKYSPWNRYKNIEYAPATLPDWLTELTELPKLKLQYPANNINNIDNYPDAVQVSDSYELYKAAQSPDCKVIFIKEGIYNLKSSILLKKGKKLIGANRDKVILEFDTDSKYLIKADSGECAIDSVTIADLKAAKKSLGFTDTSCIQVTGTKCSVSNSVIKNSTKHALRIKKDAMVTVDKCIIQKTNTILCDAKQLSISNSFIANQDSFGVYVYNCSDLKIDSNVFQNIGKHGIYCESVGSTIIKNNTVSDCGNSGIAIGKTRLDLEIAGNICCKNRNNGITIRKAIKGHISNNSCFLNGQSGIYAGNEFGTITLSSNRCFRNEEEGMYIEERYADLTGNFSADNTGAGIACNCSSALKDNIVIRNHNGGLRMYGSEITLTNNVAKWNYFSGIEICMKAHDINSTGNDFSENLWAGAHITSKGKNIKFSNNIFSENGAWPAVCYGKAVNPEFSDNTYTGNFRGNHVERKLYQTTYLKEFDEFCRKRRLKPAK